MGKFGLNVSRNLPQAILGVGIGVYDDSIYADAIMRRMRHEVVLVANAKGIPLTDEFKAAKWLPSQRYSTLQDLDAHRHTEIDMFSGALIRIGKEVGVECPYNEMTYNLSKHWKKRTTENLIIDLCSIFGLPLVFPQPPANRLP